jgi:hypothetical protein
MEWVEGLVAQGDVPDGFQQAASQIFQATDQLQGRPSELGRQIAQQAACFRDLQNQAGGL